MFIKLHHRDVRALIDLIDSLREDKGNDPLSQDEESAYSKLILMRTAMEQRLRQNKQNDQIGGGK